MITSAKAIAPENVTGPTLARASARNRLHLYDLLLGAFKRSGLSQAEVSRRSGVAAETVSRIFKRPRNVEIDTASRLLFSMTGATMSLAEEFPHAAADHVVTADKTGADADLIELDLRAIIKALDDGQNFTPQPVTQAFSRDRAQNDNNVTWRVLQEA